MGEGNVLPDGLIVPRLILSRVWVWGAGLVRGKALLSPVSTAQNAGPVGLPLLRERPTPNSRKLGQLDPDEPQGQLSKGPLSSLAWSPADSVLRRANFPVWCLEVLEHGHKSIRGAVAGVGTWRLQSCVLQTTCPTGSHSQCPPCGVIRAVWPGQGPSVPSVGLADGRRFALGSPISFCPSPPGSRAGYGELLSRRCCVH